MWAEKTCSEKYSTVQETQVDDRVLDTKSVGLLAKVYLKEGDVERWITN